MTVTSSHVSSTTQQRLQEVLLMPNDSRSMILGRTGSGKSTLMEVMLLLYRRKYPSAKVLIVDSKPRFKAEWTTNGIRAKHEYRNWSRGTFLPGSVRIDSREDNIGRELHVAYRGHHVAIAQTTPGRVADLVWLQAVATRFYGDFSDREPRLILVDELADFFEIKKMGGIFWQTARSGRELNIGLLAGSQRPSYIPNVVLTEADRLYLFALDYSEDMKKVSQMGVPREVKSPEMNHSFFYWNKFQRYNEPSGRLYQLAGVS